MAIKPILFNTEMVRAILDGRKCCTRRVVKFPVNRYTNNVPLADKVVLQELRCDKANFLEEPFFSFGMNLPYQPGDILYVRETFGYPISLNSDRQYVYRADEVAENGFKNDSHIWHPSIHMPKEAARIWLKVTDVRVERLQEITDEQAKREGIQCDECPTGFTWKQETDVHNCYTTPIGAMQALWDSTIKKSDLDRYGWDASPWVWVIEFERCEKPKLN
jgi:hypothetical protein|nr:MAG TPA: ASCH domain protein [Bacteriophage sp.]